MGVVFSVLLFWFDGKGGEGDVDELKSDEVDETDWATRGAILELLIDE